MTEKEIFIEKMKKRTKRFAVDVIQFCDSLKTCKALGLFIKVCLLNFASQDAIKK